MKGKEEILVHHPHGKRDGSDEKTVRQCNHDKEINFKVKRTFYSEIGGHVLTPDFDTYQGRVLQRGKCSEWCERWIWKGDRASPMEILLTGERQS